MPHDSQHRPVRAMAPQTAPAPGASRAIDVELAHHALADQLPRPREHLAHELVPRNPAEAGVTPEELDIGIANARVEHPDQREALPRRGPWRRAQSYLAFVEVDGEHRGQEPS